MKKLLALIFVALCTISIEAQEKYVAIERNAETGAYTLSKEFKAVLPLNEDGSYGDVATNKDERGSVVVMKTASVTVEAVGGSTPAQVPDVAGDNTATHVDINADGTVNSWDDIKWQQKSQGDINWAWIQGTGTPAAKIEAEAIMTDDAPATYVDENGVEHTKYRPVYTFYNPDGSLGVPEMGLYYKVTATKNGSIKIGVRVNKGNRNTYVVDAATALPVAYKAMGYINGQNETYLQGDGTEASRKKYLTAEEIESIHKAAKVNAETGEDIAPYVIGAGNQPFFGHITFKMEAGKTYYVFCENTQLGFNGWIFDKYITFADSKVKEICVAYWDTNSDGELSYAEAAAVTSLGEIFKENTEINAFNELQYFVGINVINAHAFNGCTNLESVVLPKSVKRIMPHAFENCEMLNALHIPANVSSINDAAIRAANGLVRLTVDESNPVFDSRNNCNAVIETATNTLIVGCNTSVIPNGIEAIGVKAFRDMTKLFSVIIPNSVTAIGDNAFDGCDRLTSVTVGNKTPFTISESVFSNCSNATLYVPAGSREAYQAAGYWEKFKEIIEIDNISFADSKVKETLLNADFGDIGLGSWNTCVSYENISVTVGDYVLASDDFEDDKKWTHNIGDWTIIDGKLQQSQIAENCTSVFDLPARGTYSYKVRARKDSGNEGFLILFNRVDDSNLMWWNIGGWYNSANAIEVMTNGSKKIVAYEGGTIETGRWYDIEIRLTEDDVICLLDNVVIHRIDRNLLHSAVDSNGDNEIAKEEAAAITDIGTIFKGNKKITSFNELQYFTGVTSLSEAFNGCSNLVSVKLPESLEKLQYSAFEKCTSLSALHIPANVNFVGNDVIRTANALTVLTVDENNEVYDSRNNCNAVIETATNTLIVGCNTSVIPNDVETIGLKAFRYMTGLTSITIPNSVTKICENAFDGCVNLEALTIPSSVTSIGAGAFAGCYSLNTVTVGNSTPVELIDGSTFSNRANATLYVPAGSKAAYKKASVWDEFKEIIEIENITFADSKVKEICVANWDTNGDGELSYAEAAVSSIGKTFKDNKTITSFDELQYFTGVDTIKASAFSGCNSLVSVTLPNTVKEIQQNAFYATSLESIKIPASVNTIEAAAINSCSNIKSIVVEERNAVYDSRNNCNGIVETATNTLIVGCMNTIIPDDITSIGESVFRGNDSLKQIVIPNSVTSIGKDAFYRCSALTSVTVGNSTPVELTDGNTFSNRANATLYVPAGSKEAYEAASVWNRFKEIVPIATVTINKYGSGTYCSPYALDFTNVSGMKAYVAAGYNTTTNTVYMLSVKTAQPGEGLFIKGAPGDYVVPEIETSTDNYLNLLVGTTNEVTVNTQSDDGKYTNYAYSLNKGTDAPDFYKFSYGSKCKAYKAYLQIPTSWLPTGSEAKTVKLVFDDEEPTGIEEFRTEKDDDDVKIYDMQGRRVTKPGKGLYIVNGKKVVFK